MYMAYYSYCLYILTLVLLQLTHDTHWEIRISGFPLHGILKQPTLSICTTHHHVCNIYQTKFLQEEDNKVI